MSVAPPKVLLAMRVNGADVECAFSPSKTLLEVVREDLGLTGTKHGCEMGHCGACTVLVDGVPVLSCLELAVEAQGREVTTVEGLAHGAEMHPVQTAFAECGAAQCGYCTPGFLVSAAALLDGAAGKTLTPPEIGEALAGNLCRCTGYTKIVEAVTLANRRMAGQTRG
ncbi:MAG TPA: (2Fe-2S)-binding protein [Candidatus Eremiobacteraceae bacterium]|nr:(2Fe-2S)-binding protein [Candidatus Eremiobacteraceae bacterium]